MHITALEMLAYVQCIDFCFWDGFNCLMAMRVDVRRTSCIISLLL